MYLVNQIDSVDWVINVESNDKDNPQIGWKECKNNACFSNAQFVVHTNCSPY